MGTAFHAALEFLSRCSPSQRNEVIGLFRKRLLAEREEASKNYREANQIWPGDLRESMEVALAARAGPFTRAGVRRPQAIESTLRSADGLLLGRPDEVIESPSGPTIVDYKTGDPRNANLPELEDQLHFYAGLWQETRNERVRNGVAVFLLDGSRHQVDIDQDRIQAILEDARTVASAIPSIVDWFPEANVGVHCRTCNFRPWCHAYWKTGVRAEAGTDQADLEGFICGDHARDNRAFCLRTSEGHRLLINRSEEPLPSLAVGTRVRVIDAGAQDSVVLRFRWSEVWRLGT